MPGILNSQVEKYLNGLLPKSDGVLAEMERYARRHDVPIIGPACGRLLFQLAQIAGANRIFEMGSAIGYSTIWFARAAGPEGEVFYTDGDPANAERARDYLHRAGVQDRVRIRVGDAFAALDGTSGSFDLILIDIDKHQYPAALRKALPRLRRGGLLVTDNVLWSGRVASKAKDADTRAIRQFNRTMYRSRGLFPVIVPLRDGVAVCRKA
ncbi:MAG TPA: O-methyltransferase [Candidatus Acidoferrales bacterium]|nr:O-methyltransferase [Candidatus Acidoferrales bacterium]